MSDDERSAWGALIVERREQLGMTQEQLAAAADVAPKTIYNMEAGGRTPQPRTLRKVQRALGLSTDIEIARLVVDAEREVGEARRALGEAERAREEDIGLIGRIAGGLSAERDRKAELDARADWLRARLLRSIRSRHLADWRGLLEVIEVMLDALDGAALQAVFDHLVADPRPADLYELVTTQHPVSRGPIESAPPAKVAPAKSVAHVYEELVRERLLDAEAADDYDGTEENITGEQELRNDP